MQRGGWGAGRGEYLLLHRTADGKPAEARTAFSGLDDQLAAFVEQVADASAGPTRALATHVLTMHRCRCGDRHAVRYRTEYQRIEVTPLSVLGCGVPSPILAVNILYPVLRRSVPASPGRPSRPARHQ